MMNIDTRYDTIKLFFKESEHKYNDIFGNNYTSCTTLLHNYTPAFNRDYWLRKKSKELGKSEKEIAKDWKDITDESCNRGNATHNYLEDGIRNVSMFKKAVQYLTDMKSGQMVTVADLPKLIVKPLDIPAFIKATDNKYPEIYSVFKYYTDNGYIIYSEIGCFLIDYLISGTIDVLAVREDQFVILDWKTNKDGLIFESGYYRKDKSQFPHQITNEWVRKDDRMNAPVSHLPDCNGIVYSLQLSMYATMVSLITGLPCAGLGLCHIGTQFILNEYYMPKRDARGGYEIDTTKPEKVQWFKINYYHKECMDILNDHKITLNATAVNTQFKLNMI